MVNNLSCSLRWAHSENSHHMKNEGERAGEENPVKGSIEIKLNIYSLRENNSVKQMHAGLDVFFFSRQRQFPEGRQNSPEIFPLSDDIIQKAKCVFQILFIQAELMKRA